MDILSCDRVKKRAQKFVKIIKIAKALFDLHNFNSCMAVIAALNDGPVYRLKHTKAELSEKHLQTMKELEAALSADNAYSAYKEILSKTSKPCIPYLYSLLVFVNV